MSTLVIAEAASAHDGSIDKALRLIEAAKACGADVCKFQYWSSADRHAARRRAPEYLNTYRRYRVPVDWLLTLKAHCVEVGIDFACSVCLPEDVPIVAPFVKYLKISSFEADDGELWRACLATGVHLIVSHGLGESSLGGHLNLHCVSAYPTPLEQLNLAAIREGRYDGFSDHSGAIDAGFAAVCAGAQVIEVHMKLPDTDPANPDAGPFALLPDDLHLYVDGIRRAELMMGDGEKRIMPSEHVMLRYKVRS